MKILAIVALILLTFSGAALAQENSCSFDLVGTWKAQVSTTQAILYRFDSKGEVTVLSVTGTAEPKQISTASYEVINDINAPRTVAFTATGKNRIFGALRKTMKVDSYDDTSINCSIPGVGKVRWTRVETDRYFIVLAARSDEFWDRSGSSFQVLIKMAGGVPTIDAFGIYAVEKQIAFGTVPASTYKEFLKDTSNEMETVLRLEINSRQYERAMQVVKEWQRRVRENATLYSSASDVSEDPAALNNILVVKAITETLNQCSEDFDLYKLNYVYPEDYIADKTKPSSIPFVYFRELRRRNEARHIGEQKFQELVHIPNLASR